MVRGKYRILNKLGEGGMAVVYKVLHVRFDELRALKVITPDLAGDHNFVKRFMHEAVITRKLRHPNAVRVEDIDEAEDGRPFIVMEYIEGRSLKEVIQIETRMAVGRVCSIAKQVAAALDAAHKLGMVHRDIKPANIVLVGTPQPTTHGEMPVHHYGGVPADLSEYAKVLDFGIAKIKEAHIEETRLRLATLTGTGMVIGTPAYMSPEQAMGKRGEQLDGRSDLYSLGIVMYEMLTGELPLDADSEMRMLMAQINQMPPDIRSRRPDLPEPIALLVMRCLKKTADQRPESARALIEEIEYWEGQPARPVDPRRDQERPARRNAETKPAEQENEQEQPARARGMSLRGKLWVGIAAGVVVLGALIWHFSAGSAGVKSQPRAETAAVGSGSSESTTRTRPENPPATSQLKIPSPVASVPHEVSKQAARPTAADAAAHKAEIEKRIRAWVTEADVDYEDGLYDDAIRLYQTALNLSPKNQAVLSKIRRARRAKETENALNH
ncbi:MAG: protein kinase [Acidobacteriaceae bacterium]|nr:protein kinase [Acidobacteriaceae bacterium]